MRTMSMGMVMVMAGCLSLLGACGVEPAGGETGFIEQAAQGLPPGCRVDCPVCPPHKICPRIACRIICHGPHCAGDADCHLEANYCGGCNCEALTNAQHATSCPEAHQVLCLAEPCQFYTPVCDPSTHRCVAQPL